MQKEKDRAYRLKKNRMIFARAGLPFKKRDRRLVYLFRGPGVKIDFYTTTGRWRDIIRKKTFSGGAGKLLVRLKRELKYTRNGNRKR